MNNYVSKEVAIVLKEAGFEEQCYSYFDSKGDSVLGEYFNGASFALFPNCVARPDYLTAADWLWKNHEIASAFCPTFTQIALSKNNERTFAKADHRNEALLYALKQIQK